MKKSSRKWILNFCRIEIFLHFGVPDNQILLHFRGTSKWSKIWLLGHQNGVKFGCFGHQNRVKFRILKINISFLENFQVPFITFFHKSQWSWTYGQNIEIVPPPSIRFFSASLTLKEIYDISHMIVKSSIIYLYFYYIHIYPPPVHPVSSMYIYFYLYS